MKSVILSAFADEASQKPRELFTAVSALGLRYYTPRFFDFGSGPINSMLLSPQQLSEIYELQKEFGIQAATFGSPIGKTKLVDREDGNKAQFASLETVLAKLDHAIALCKGFGTKRLRAFSFYGLHGDDPGKYINQAAEYLRACTEKCAAAGILYGMEVEANLVGRNADLLLELVQKVNHPSLGLVFDGGNLHSQGYNTEECVQQFRQMLPYLLWMHVKDYAGPMPEHLGGVHEESLQHFVTADVGGSGHAQIFAILATELDSIEKRLLSLGIEDGFVIDDEPHLKGGGQFGGKSGPDGLGVASHVTRTMLLNAGITPKLTDFAEIRLRRGF